MKQTISTFKTLRHGLLCLTLLAGLSAYGEGTEINGLFYNLDSTTRTASVTYETLTNTNYASLGTDVTIPESPDFVIAYPKIHLRREERSVGVFP